MGKILGKIINLFQKGNGYLAGIFALLFAFSGWFVDLVLDLTVWALAQTAVVEVPDFKFQLADYENLLGLANHFFPVAEAWTMLVVAVPFMLFIVILRFVKQFIPMIAN